MVTDYSSVAFDFAYMKKSLVYAQFDREAFFEGQTYDEGYFNYETDGFGPYAMIMRRLCSRSLMRSNVIVKCRKSIRRE